MPQDTKISFNKIGTRFLLLMLASFLLMGCATQAEKPRPQKGQLDLRSFDILREGNIGLAGEWEFYWQKLLTYPDLQQAEPDILVDVPNTWDQISLGGQYLPGQGYATYRLHVQTMLPPGTALGININTLSSAYRLYVDEQLITEVGEVAKSVADEVGQYRPKVVIFHTPALEFDLIVQVSNYHHARGGFWDPVILGSDTAVLDYYEGKLGREIFLIGGLFIVCLFYFSVYCLVRDFRYTLYFAAFCFFLIVAVDTVNQFIL